VKRAVELAVAAAVEAVAVGVARGGRDRGGPAGARELGVGGESVGAGDLADELGGGQWAAPAFCEQLRRVAFDHGGELCLYFADPGGARGGARALRGSGDSPDWRPIRTSAEIRSLGEVIRRLLERP